MAFKVIGFNELTRTATSHGSYTSRLDAEARAKLEAERSRSFYRAIVRNSIGQDVATYRGAK